MSTTQIPLLSQPSHDFMHSRNQSGRSKYDPFSYPPDLNFARLHASAQNVGGYVPPKEDTERCPCCLAPVHKPYLQLSCHLRQLLHLGEAYPLYFHFIKQCIILLVINILICSLPSLLINLSQGGMCVELDGLVYSFYGLICKSSVINIMNVQEIDMLQIQSIFNFIAIIVSILVIGVLEISMVEKYNEFKDHHEILPKASEYSVQVRGLPKDIMLSEIVKFVQQKLLYSGAADTAVLKIYVIYSMRQYYRLYANKSSSIEKLVALNTNKNQLKQKIDQIGPSSIQTDADRKKLQKLQNKLKNALEEINQIQNRNQMIQIQINNYQELFKIVIQKFLNETFEYQEEEGLNQIADRADIQLKQDQNKANQLKLFKEDRKKSRKQSLQIQNIEGIDATLNGLKLKFSGKCIITLNNVQSRDILVGQTENMYFLQKMGYKLSQFLGGTSGSIVITEAPEPPDMIFENYGSEKIKQWKDWLCVTVLLTFIILFDFVLLTLSKKFVKEEKALNKENLMFSFLNSQLIALFNSIVSRVIRVSENKTQMHSTHSSYYYSVTSKLVILFLINMLITTFFSNLVNYYLIEQKTRTYDRFPLNFEEYLFDLFFLVITNPFISVFLIFFDHRQGYKLWRRYRISSGAEAVTQAQANAMYQNMQIDLSNKYGNIYRFVLFAAGICFIYPPALIICLASISGFYWLDKYLLLRRYTIPHKLGFKLTHDMQHIFWMFPLLQAATNLVIMFVPIQDGTAFKEGKYSKGFYYLALVGMIIAVIVYLGGCNWVVSLLKWVLSKDKSRKSKEANSKKYKMYYDSMKYPTYKQIELDFEEDYWHHYPYFRINKKKKNSGLSRSSSLISQQSSSPTRKSPRRSKINELQQKAGMDVFDVIKNHLHHEKYSPIV